MNHYKTLGVAENATEDDIKKAYRKLAMKHHPDRNKGNQESEEQFKKIGEAYGILSDPIKKREYDQQQAYSSQDFSGFNQGHTSFHDGDMNDFINEMFNNHRSPFGDIFGQQFNQRRARRQVYGIRISFWEAVFGVQKQFELVDEKGIRQNFTIPFPPGLEDESTIEVQIGNEQTILIHINIEPDPHFTRNHLDLHVEVDIPMSKALLGGKVTFPHWEHDYEVVVPAGTQQGQILTIPNGGIKKDMFIGDLYLKCNISIPKKLTKKQKELLEEYAKTEKENTSFFDTLKNSWSNFFKK